MKLTEKYYALLPIALLCLFYTYKALDFPVHDFANYYFGGNLFASGNLSSNIYYPSYFNSVIAGLGHKGIFVSYAPNTPFLSLAFLPFSFIPLIWAKLLFNGISVILFLYSLSRLGSFYNIRTIYLLALPILFFVPIKNDLLFGQVYLLLFFLLAESWLAYEKKQNIKMAILLAFAIVLKVFPVILVFILLFRKQFRQLTYVLVFSIALIALSAIFTGCNIWSFFFSHVLPKASAGEIATAFVDNYQSVFMFLKRIFVYDAIENPDAFANYPFLLPILIFAFKVMLLVIGYYISRKAPDSLMVYSYWIVAMILLSPYGSTYAFIFMLFPLFALLKSNLSNMRKGFAMLLLFTVNNIPLAFFSPYGFPISYLRLIFLLAFLCLLLWMAYKYVNWKVVIVAALFPLLLIFSEKKATRITSEPLITDGNSPILMTGYAIKNGQLTYYYWDEKGMNEKSLSLPINTVTRVDESDGQLYFYGKKLTADTSSKLKPVVINGKTLIYLSDLGRGIGFYTLRKIELK